MVGLFASFLPTKKDNCGPTANVYTGPMSLDSRQHQLHDGTNRQDMGPSDQKMKPQTALPALLTLMQ